MRIATTETNRAYVEAQVAAQHTLSPDRLTRAPRAPVLGVFQGETVVGSGTRRVRLYSVGKTAHALDTVVAYLPAEQIMFRPGGMQSAGPRAGGAA